MLPGTCVNPGELTIETVPQAQRPPPGWWRALGATGSSFRCGVSGPEQSACSRQRGPGSPSPPHPWCWLGGGLRGYPGNSLGSPTLDSRLNGYSQGRRAASAPGPLWDWPPRPCPFWSAARLVHRRLCSRRPGSTRPVWLPRRLLVQLGWGGPGWGWHQHACGQCVSEAVCVWGSVCGRSSVCVQCVRGSVCVQCVCSVGQCV